MAEAAVFKDKPLVPPTPRLAQQADRKSVV